MQAVVGGYHAQCAVALGRCEAEQVHGALPYLECYDGGCCQEDGDDSEAHGDFGLMEGIVRRNHCFFR